MRRHPAENMGIVDERTKEIDGLHELLAGRYLDDRGIVGRLEADHDISPLNRLQPAEYLLEYGAADFRGR